ncbi:uncharacterized protein LOC117304939 [Asterias rubens]|uniref:uncharacterized protein LOC117304939 n=1 Tax=Asterias rubens TaxID=7604 RepID=UPI00145592B4|nr:uncharacterized protein LOC117304939 [Asterias rubens]
MASDHAPSDVEGSLTSFSALSWWSDSERYHRGSSTEESPWWESDSDVNTQWEVRQESPIPSEVFVGNVSSPSSVTPTWWSEPSSRHLSTSGTEVEVNPRGKCHVREGGQQSGTNDEEVKSKPKNNRKRLREQYNVLGNDEKEPPTTRLKPNPSSLHADLATVANDIKKGIVEPLQIFLLFFTVDVLNKICDLTNTNAWEVVLVNPAFAGADGAWEDVTVKEMQIFIAIVQIMRRNPDVGFGSFWREERDGEHWPRTLMKRSRFFAIVQLLTVADPPNIKKTSRMQDSNSQEAEKIREPNSQSGTVTEKSDCYLYFFDQIKTVLKTFQQQFNVQFAEKVINRKVSTAQDEIFNFMKVVRSPSDETKTQSPTQTDSKLVPDLKLDVLKRSEVMLQVNSSRPSNGLESVNGQESSKEDSKELVKLSNNIPGVIEERPVVCDKSLGNQSADLNVISLNWHDGNGNVTFDLGCSEQSDVFSGDVAVEGTPDPGYWQSVFLPCPEVIYNKDAISVKDDANVAQSSGRSFNPPLAKSFFYHYLNLVHYFSMTEALLCPVSACSVEAGKLSTTDLGDQIIDGLVSLGDVGLLSPSDSDSEMRESDVSRDTSSDEAGGEKSGDESGGDNQNLHKYVQARSRIGQKCALCWSLHREVRKVHTRCTRCGRHFCLSRFRNCMDEAHDDLETMQQILDEESS